MFSVGTYENSRPDGIGVLEVVEKQGPRFVPLKRTELRGEISGPLAALRMTQVFGYSREQCEAVLEAIYRFPLPGDAAVRSVTVRFGEVQIQAELKERRQAEAEYQEAKASGQQATLLTREAPDVFSLAVAGIQPDQPVTVETSYVQLARAEGAGWSLRVPLTTAPRYVRGDERDARPAQGQPLALLRDPGHRFLMDLSLVGAAAVQSPTHDLATSQVESAVRVQLRDGHVIPDRDCVLRWEPQRAAERATLQAWGHDDPATGQRYFLAAVAPPLQPPQQAPAREIIVLVDHSGSMEGPKWEAADWAVKAFLSGLRPGDHFNLGLFHNHTRWFEAAPCPAQPETIDRAMRFLDTYRDSGGTELGVALEQALALQRRPAASRHVLLITDAEVTDAGRILRLADQEWQRADHRRISVLCIDAAPNAFLAGELAERSGGVAHFLTSAPQEEDIASALDAVLADWAQPVLAGLALEVNRSGLQASGRRLRSANAMDIGDLPLGRTVWVAGRVPLAGDAELVLQLLAANDRPLASCTLAPDGPALPALKALFGARRVLGLEQLIGAGYDQAELATELDRLGYDSTTLPSSATTQSVYAENRRAMAERMLHDLLVRESLTYGLASSETAFVAVRSEHGKQVEGTVAVANALPSGWSERFASAHPGMPMRALSFHAHGAFAAMSAPPSPPAPMPLQASPTMGATAQAPQGRRAFQLPWARLRAQAEAAPAPEFAGHGLAKEVATTAAGQLTLFSGRPGQQAVTGRLYDSVRDASAGSLPGRVTLSRLHLLFPDGAPAAGRLDAQLCLLLYVDDMATPRAKVRVADLVRQGGARPLHILKLAGQAVRLELLDPSASWASGGPRITVILEWQP